MIVVQPIRFYAGRYIFTLLFFALCLCGLAGRLIYLTVIDRSFLQRQGDARSLRIVDLPTYRGMITDRSGTPLAISTPVESVWLNPQVFDADDTLKLSQLADLLQIPAADILNRVEHAETKGFIYLKRGLEPYLAQRVKQLNIPGVNLQQEFRRYYPTAEVSAHILGVTNVDDQGQEGMELAYNEWLAGQYGKQRVIKDRLGRVVEDLGVVAPPRPGKNLVLSIDRRIQYLAYRELKEAMEVNKSSSASAIVLDTVTGEILAMVNQPSFNPNARTSPATDGRYRNRAVTDLFEPGSVIKPFTLAAVLNSGKFKPTTQVDARPGLVVDGHLIRDIHASGVITVTEVLQRSSNVGVTRMILSLPATTLWTLLDRIGFGKLTNSGFPGESEGRLVNHRRWTPFIVATLGFGYGLSVTPLQLAQAFSIFANDGQLRPVSLLRRDTPEQGTQVISSVVAQQMLTMLEAVVEQTGGTGSKARVPGYRVAGKTGTARMVGANGYEKDHHVASFAGIAPVSKPRLVVLVVFKDPDLADHYGGQVAAPVFSKIMAGALQILQIPPDKLA